MSQMTKDFKPKLKLKVGIPAHDPIQRSWRETVVSGGPWSFVRVEIHNEQVGYESLDYYGFTYANEDDFNATDYYLLNMIEIYFS